MKAAKNSISERWRDGRLEARPGNSCIGIGKGRKDTLLLPKEDPPEGKAETRGWPCANEVIGASPLTEAGVAASVDEACD